MDAVCLSTLRNNWNMRSAEVDYGTGALVPHHHLSVSETGWVSTPCVQTLWLQMMSPARDAFCTI